MAKGGHKIKISIRPPDYGSSKLLLSYVNKQLNTLGTVSDKVSAADVRLKHERSATSEDRVCEIYLKVGAKNIFAIQKSSTFEESTLRAVNKLREHVRRMDTPPEPPQEQAPEA